MFVLRLAVALLLLLELVEHVSDALFAHFDPHDLHYFSQVSDVNQNLFFRQLSFSQLLANILLTRLDQFDIILCHKSHRGATSARSRCPTHTMHVILWCFRHIKIDHHLDHRYVQSSTRHISSNHDLHVLRLKLGQVSDALSLSQLRMNESDFEAKLSQQHR